MSNAVVGSILNKVRAENPLVHNITNYVVIQWTANCLLSAGASPVMAHALEEVEEMAKLAKALVINVGTLSPPWVASMERAMATAAKHGVPIVIDPVGAGATTYRTETVKRLTEKFTPTLVRGNASEILALAREHKSTKGVDSQASSRSAIEAAMELSHRLDCVVCVTGETDYVVEKNKTVAILNGHPLMAKVTGMGCAATALAGAFLAVHSSALEAAASAMVVTGVAGELAAEAASGPGSFQPLYLDALYNLSAEQITEHQKIR